MERRLFKFLKTVQQKLESGSTETIYAHFPLQEQAVQFAASNELAPSLRSDAEDIARLLCI